VLSVNERWLEILLTPLRDQITVAETCRRYGISRQIFYVYQRRLFADGVVARSGRRSQSHHRAVLRELTLGPVGTYHSNGRKRGRPRKSPENAPPQVPSAMSWQQCVRDVPGPYIPPSPEWVSFPETAKGQFSGSVNRRNATIAAAEKEPVGPGLQVKCDAHPGPRT
jgi:hypothetical protein